MSRLLVPAAWTLAVLVGCQKPPDIVQVSGVVLLDGRPLADAVVTFQPVRDGGTLPRLGGSVGRTDEAGRFSLRLIEPDSPGAAVGKHVVTITTAVSGPSDAVLPRRERVPRSWRDGSQIFEVTSAGTTTARIEMRSR